MTAWVSALQDASWRIWQALPTAQQFTSFVSDQDVPDRLAKLGRLLPWPLMAVQRASGTVSARTIQIIEAGNLWNWSRVPITMLTYGVNILPLGYGFGKDFVQFAIDVAKGKRRVETRMARDPAVQFNRYAVGKIEKAILLIAKSSMTMGVGLFAYVVYVGIPAMVLDQHFLSTDFTGESLEGVLESVTPVISAAYLLFAVRASGILLFNKLARARARVETPDSAAADDLQLEYDRRVYLAELVGRVLEGIEYAFLSAGIGGLPSNKAATAALQNWNPQNMTVTDPLSLPDNSVFSTPVTSLEWFVWAIGLVGFTSFLRRIWIQTNPPKFDRPNIVELEAVKVVSATSSEPVQEELHSLIRETVV